MRWLRTKWTCHNCEMPSMRYWNVQHHISRWHDGRGQPYNHDTIQYDRLQQRHILPSTSYIPNSDSGQESYKKFDLFMDLMIKQYIKLIDFKNLCSIILLNNPLYLLPNISCHHETLATCSTWLDY